MAHTIYASGLLLAAVIHLLPLVGVLGAARLTSLYGISLEDQNLILLLRHRAVLFGLLGIGLAIAAFRPQDGPPALVAGLVSVGTFLVLAPSAASLTPALQKVVVADWIALVALVAATIAWRWQHA